MDKPLSLRHNFLWTFAGNVINAACLWGIISVATKIGTAEMVGKLEISRAIDLPVMAAVMLQLRNVQVTDMENTYAFADYFGARLFTSALGIIVITAIALYWYSGETAVVIVLWGLAKSIDVISDIIRGLFQRYERMNLSSISLIIRGLAALTSMGTLLWLTGNLPIAIGGLVVVWSLLIFIYDLPTARRLLRHHAQTQGISVNVMPRFHIKTIFVLLWTAFPLGLALFLGSLRDNIPKLVLGSYYGEKALGYFGPILYFIVLGTMVVSALSQSATPRLAIYYVNNLPAYRRLMKKLFLLSLIIGVALIALAVVAGRFLLTVAYTADYASYHLELTILSTSGILVFMIFFCNAGLTAARVFKTQVLGASVSCATAVLAAYLFIPRYGIRGAAVTVLVSLISMLFCSLGVLIWATKKREKELALEKRSGV